MSVIIRLQNLPWTANARDIRNFFTGLSIPEGGVHIIGGEMGDAFIAFSTDEDARCAMLKDREKLMEVQVRLLLSSRAEMQKIIETARKVSVAAAAAAAVVATTAAAPAAGTAAAAATPQTVGAAATSAMPPVPQPPIIGSFIGQLKQQAQQQQQQIAPVLAPVAAPSFLAYQQQAGITLADVAGLKVERHSPDHFKFSSRRRHTRSHSRSTSSDDSDHSRDHSDRDRVRDRDTRDRDTRGRKRRPDVRSDSSERDLKMPTQSNPMPWATVAPATATVAAAAAAGLSNVPGLQQQLSIMSVLQPVPGLQSYSTSTNSSTTSTTNHYNFNLTAATPQQQQQPQQQHAMLPEVGLSSKQVTTNNSGQDQPIAFANVNPYAQMYPQLFQQQQLLLQQQAAKTAAGMGNSPSNAAVGDAIHSGAAAGGAAGVGSVAGAVPIAETCYIKISGMCPTTSYSDLRKYFAGLYIPHNGIKIVSGANGVRLGVAYIEFSRVSSAQKALSRHNTMFRDRLVQIVPIGDEEFEQVDERASRNKDGGGRGEARSAAGALPPISVLYVEDLPQLTTEQDIMKMFSATCTIVDILLTPSPNNRREFVAFVLFARENEARSALDDTSRHYIGFRKLRVRASNQVEMQNAKEKMRRANEQLQKEEQQQREDAEREQLNKQQQQQLLQQQQQQQQQEQLLALQAKFSHDPRRRSNNEVQQHQQQQQQQHPHSHNHNNNTHNNLQPFGNPAMHNGNMPFGFQQMQNNSNNNGMPMHNNNNNGMSMHNNNNNNGMHMNHNNNNNMAPFGMQMLNNNNNNNNQQLQQMQQQQQQQRRQEDVFVRVHNCEYATRINDLGELFLLENLRIEHIEMLFNERNQSAGEFIVEFVDAHNAKLAIREFHNRRFRGRGLRLAPITPQEIADRMNKPFMDYLPGGNGPRQADKNSPLPQQKQQQQQQQQQQQPRRRGPSRFDDASNRGMGQQQQQSQPLPHDSDDSNSSKQQHFNPFAVRGGPDLDHDDLPATSPLPASILNGSDEPPTDEGIPDKFNRPGCVVSMRNVPFKADLKDILRFFSDYKLSPDDIIRRFNDEGKPTGDARVAFESQSEARSAFESRRRKQIFNRTVFLDII